MHVGVRGADRAIAVCDRMRTVLPELLAISANSPFLDGRDSGLHSVRTQIFTKSFPRCGVPDAFGDWATYADYVEFLVRTNCVSEQTQIWWSVRPHHAFGTVEVRICDAQSTAEESTALAALAVACVAQAAREFDEGTLPDPPAHRFIEENMWRAIRYGQEGKLIDLYAGEEFPSAATADRLLAWTAPARADQLGGLEPVLPERNGAQRQRAALAAGATHAGGIRGRGGADPAQLCGREGDDVSETDPMPGDPGEPSEEQIAAFEEQLKRIRVEDVLVQTLVTLVNLGARRLGLTGEADSQDLGQARLAIEGARALLPLVPQEGIEPVRDALSQLQMAFVRETGGAPAPGAGRRARSG